MIDVDGVVVDGRPEDGRHWQTSLDADLGISPAALREHFFAPHWDRIVLGHDALLERLTAALQRIAPEVSPAEFLAYWFQRDARLNGPLLHELSLARAAGVRVYLATNQEHLRAAYLMQDLGLAAHVDGIFYSARLHVKKPHTAFFAMVQAAIALPGDELLLIDDTRENVVAARAAGWNAVRWTIDSLPTLVRSWYVN